MREVPVSGGRYVALVDDEDYERVMQHKWWHCWGYAYTQTYHKGKKTTIRLHRFIMNAGPDVYVDHKDRDKLNCRKENLRFCGNAENQWNSVGRGGHSKYKGVERAGRHWKSVPWMARIGVHGKRIYLGMFKTEIDAALAYDSAAKRYHGEFARTNF